MAKLAVELAGVKFKNPICTASGTCGFGRELSQFFDLSRLGGIFAKGTTLEARPGNAWPRVAECTAGMLNAIGLQNVGIDRVKETDLPWLVRHDLAVFVNIAGYRSDDFAEVAARLDGFPGLAGIELNISCPNVEEGLTFGSTAKGAAEVVSKVRKRTSLPLFTKLSPNVTDICEIVRAVEDAGTDAFTIMNTLIGMEIDRENRRPLLGNKVGGLCGPATHPVAVHMTWRVAQATKLPIVGLGGVRSAEDAVDFLMAGAFAVAIGSGNLVNPMITMEVIDGLDKWLDDHGYADVHDIIGAAL